jgi:hypothetical protein
MTSRPQKVFVDFNKSHYPYFTHVNIFFLEGVLKIIFGIELYMFRTSALSIIRSLALYTQH